MNLQVAFFHEYFIYVIRTQLIDFANFCGLLRMYEI